MITRFRRWRRYRRELARLMGDVRAAGDPVRSRQRYDEMRDRARQDV